MDKLPVELIIQELIKMPESDLNKYKMTNKRIYSIYKENIKYIYTEKIKKEFNCIENPKDLYLILKETPNDLIQNACRKNFKQIIKCKEGLNAYIKKILNNFGKYHITTQIPIVIEMYNNIYNCFTESPLFYKKSFLEILSKKINENNKSVINTKKISRELELKWEMFYKTKLSKLLKMIQDRLNTL